MDFDKDKKKQAFRELKHLQVWDIQKNQSEHKPNMNAIHHQVLLVKELFPVCVQIGLTWIVKAYVDGYIINAIPQK